MGCGVAGQLGAAARGDRESERDHEGRSPELHERLGASALATARQVAARENALETHKSPIDRREPSDEAMSATAARSIRTKAAAYRLTHPRRRFGSSIV
jgi:hypothetical protein